MVVAVASQALDLLMFLACSRTLVFASSIEAPVAVERARTNCVVAQAFEAVGTRILEAEKDMTASAEGTGMGEQSKKTGAQLL